MRAWLGRRQEWLWRFFFLETVALVVVVVHLWRRDANRDEEERLRQAAERGRQAGHDQVMAQMAEAQHSVMRSVADSVRALNKVTADMSAETSRSQTLALRVGVATALGGVVLGAIVGPLATRALLPNDPASYVLCATTEGDPAGLVPSDEECPDGTQAPQVSN